MTGRDLDDVFDQVWEDTLAASPETATRVGEAGHDSRWYDPAAEGSAERVAARQQLLSAARAAAVGAGAAPQLSVELLAAQVADETMLAQWPRRLLCVNQLFGPHLESVEVLAMHDLSDPGSAEAALERIRGLPALLAATGDMLGAGAAAGVTPPRVAVGEVPAQVAAHLGAQAPIPALFTGTEYETQAGRLYDQVGRPAFARLSEVVQQWMAACRQTTSFCDLPDGERWYEAEVTAHLSRTGVSAAELHHFGRDEVARISAEADRLARQAGHRHFRAWLAALASDPAQHFADREEFLAAHEVTVRRIEAALGTMFDSGSAGPLEVVAVAEHGEAGEADGYYLDGAEGRPGRFYVNCSNLAGRLAGDIDALCLHEGVPGHHLQGSVAAGAVGLPKFRRHHWSTAYGEGWALYAETLGGPLGCYRSREAQLGGLMSALWRAVRLVVDTGLHAYRWSPQRARAFMADALGRSPHDLEIAAEVDRYLVWPGQALAYSFGARAITDARAEWMTRGGTLAGFHRAVLAGGCLPLGLLETHLRSLTAD